MSGLKKLKKKGICRMISDPPLTSLTTLYEEENIPYARFTQGRVWFPKVLDIFSTVGPSSYYFFYWF